MNVYAGSQPHVDLHCQSLEAHLSSEAFGKLGIPGGCKHGHARKPGCRTCKSYACRNVRRVGVGNAVLFGRAIAAHSSGVDFARLICRVGAVHVNKFFHRQLRHEVVQKRIVEQHVVVRNYFFKFSTRHRRRNTCKIGCIIFIVTGVNCLSVGFFDV